MTTLLSIRWHLVLKIFFPSSEHSDVNVLLGHFHDIVQECISKFVPQKCIKRNSKHPGYTREIIQLTRRIKRLRKGRSLLSVARSPLLNSLKCTLKAKMQEAKNFYFNNTLSRFMVENPTKFWKSINPKSSVQSCFLINDQSCSDSNTIAESFNNYFKSVFSRDDGTIPDYACNFVQSTIPDITISCSGVHNLILKLDVTKSSGPDGIPNTFLRRYSEWCARYLTVIFNKSFASATVPILWKTANVVPLFKSGNKQLIPNYRPISLISTSCKLLEHIIHKHIVEYLDANNLLSRCQHGFRAGFSTTTQLLEFTHDIATSLNKRGQTDAIFIDYSKAFDNVCHKKLLLKLSSFLEDSKLLCWIADYLRSRSQFVTFNQVQSSPVEITSGVPQGSVLGPLLFIIFINDVVNVISGTPVNIRLYADDCVLYNCITTFQDQSVLNNVFSLFCDWSSTWQMPINYKKTVAMTFSNKKQPLSFSYNYNGSTLAHVSEFKYLGITFTHDLKWGKHVDQITCQALRKLGYLKRRLKNSTKDCKLTAYKTLVRPMLEYASVVWSPHLEQDKNRLESVQNKAIRFVFNRYDRDFSPSSHAHLLSLHSLEHRRTRESIILLHKIVHKMTRVHAPLSFADIPARTTRSTDALNLVPFRSRLDCFKFSFFPRVVEVWNKLDGALRRLNTVEFGKNFMC